MAIDLSQNSLCNWRFWRFICADEHRKTDRQISDDIIVKNWRLYKIFDALTLIVGMVIYALTLRSLGFLAATFLFLSLGAALLGERRFLLLIVVSGMASYGIWYLVGLSAWHLHDSLSYIFER